MTYQCTPCANTGIADREIIDGWRFCPHCGGRNAHPWAVLIVPKPEDPPERCLTEREQAVMSKAHRRSVRVIRRSEPNARARFK